MNHSLIVPNATIIFQEICWIKTMLAVLMTGLKRLLVVRWFAQRSAVWKLASFGLAISPYL